MNKAVDENISKLDKILIRIKFILETCVHRRL